MKFELSEVITALFVANVPKPLARRIIRDALAMQECTVENYLRKVTMADRAINVIWGEKNLG